MTTQHHERAELIERLTASADWLEHGAKTADVPLASGPDLRQAAALLAADAQAGGEAVPKFFLPPARHEGVVEHTAGTYYLRVTGLTIRQIKEIFEDKFLVSMMWSNGAAYPTDGVEIQFTRPQQAAQVPLNPSKLQDFWLQTINRTDKKSLPNEVYFGRLVESAHGIG